MKLSKGTFMAFHYTLNLANQQQMNSIVASSSALWEGTNALLENESLGSETVTSTSKLLFG